MYISSSLWLRCIHSYRKNWTCVFLTHHVMCIYRYRVKWWRRSCGTGSTSRLSSIICREMLWPSVLSPGCEKNTTGCLCSVTHSCLICMSPQQVQSVLVCFYDNRNKCSRSVLFAIADRHCELVFEWLLRWCLCHCMLGMTHAGCVWWAENGTGSEICDKTGWSLMALQVEWLVNCHHAPLPRDARSLVKLYRGAACL